jgi:hypothetical protein
MEYCLETDRNSFFHCDKTKEGCGHISHRAKVKAEGGRLPVGPINASVAAWLATFCESCGKPVERTP